MRKMKLDLDGLAVESFPTLPERPDPRGTVHAADDDVALFATQALYCTRGDTCRTSCGRVGECTCPIAP